MLKAYFDESYIGKQQIRFLCIAGYVSTVEKWIAFSRKWKRESNKAGIPDFHMTDFEARKAKPYSHLSDKQHGDLLRRLSTIVKQHTEQCFRIGFHEAEYIALGDGNEAFKNAWQLLAALTVARVAVWSKQMGHKERIPFVFDRGARYSGDFCAAYNYLANHKPSFMRDMSFGAFVLDDDQVNLPLKAADMIAWETCKQQLALSKDPTAIMRPSLARLLKTPHVDEFISGKMFDRIMRNLILPPDK